MAKEMIVSSNDHETRVAILEDDEVVELFIERERQRGVVGNVYKGRVSKVLPGMQSAFIDLGLERDGFLHVSDVVDTLEEFERLEAADEDDDHGGRPGTAGRDRRRCAAGRRERPAGAPGPRRPPSATARAQFRSEDRRPAPRGPGDRRPGLQGAARHQGCEAHLARVDPRALPGLHADHRARRCVAKDRLPRRASPPSWDRPPVP
jgi:Ribonuclease G/E